MEKLLVPSDATYDVRMSIQQIIDEIGSLTSRINSIEGNSGGVSRRDIDDLKRAVAAVYQKPTSLDFNDVFRKSGPAHAIGYVPDPPSNPGATKFLREDATWADPLLSYGTVQVNAGTGLTDLTGYSFNASWGTDTDIAIIRAGIWFASNTHTKYLFINIGGGSVTLVTQTTNVVENRGYLQLGVSYVNSTTARVFGLLTYNAGSGASPTLIHINTTVTVTWGSPTVIKMQSQGGADSEIGLLSWAVTGRRIY